MIKFVFLNLLFISTFFYDTLYCLTLATAAFIPTTPSSKRDVVCSGDFYFKAYDFNNPDIYFPPSNVKCDIINGSLSFFGFNASYTKLIPSSLDSLKQVSGSLNFERSKLFPSFKKLKIVDNLVMNSNDHKDLIAFKALNSITGLLSIAFSDNVKISFPNLVVINDILIKHSSIAVLELLKVKECGSIAILEYSHITSLAGLKNINKIQNDFLLQESVVAAFNFENLNSIGGSLQISGSYEDSLSIIFAKIIDIGADLKIIDSNYESINIRNFKGESVIHGSVIISKSNGPIDLSGLGAVTVHKSIIIENNEGSVKLFDVSTIDEQNGDIIIRENNNFNHPIFQSLRFIRGSFAIPQSIKQDDNFLKEYPKLKHVNGTIYIDRCKSLTNIMVVNLLDSFISLNITRNENMKSLEGLEQISSLHSLNIQENDNLESLKSLKSLNKIDGDLSIINNNKLASLEGLEKIKRVKSLYVGFNYELESLKGLNNLAYIDEDLKIDFHFSLRSLEGLESLKQVGSLKILYNDKLKSIRSLNGLIKVENQVLILMNNKLSSLDGLNNIKTIGSLSIGFNEKLGSLQGLNSLTKVDNKISIYNNENMKSIDGLDMINDIGILEIKYNENMISINGLKELNKIEMIEIDFDYQTKIKEIKIGKKGNSLGYPKVMLISYRSSKYFDLDELKQILSHICKNNGNHIIITDTDMSC